MQSNKESFMELSADCLAKAVVFVVGIYYIFHLEYPGPAKGAFICFCRNTYCMTFYLRGH